MFFNFNFWLNLLVHGVRHMQLVTDLQIMKVYVVSKEQSKTELVHALHLGESVCPLKGLLTDLRVNCEQRLARVRIVQLMTLLAGVFFKVHFIN